MCERPYDYHYFQFLFQRLAFLESFQGLQGRTFGIVAAVFLQAGCPSCHQTNGIKSSERKPTAITNKITSCGARHNKPHPLLPPSE